MPSNFETAAAFISNAYSAIGRTSSSSQRVKLYALYQQATKGDVCTSGAPWSIEVEARAKFNAWAALKGTSKSRAEILYVEEVIAQAKELSLLCPEIEDFPPCKATEEERAEPPPAASSTALKPAPVYGRFTAAHLASDKVSASVPASASIQYPLSPHSEHSRETPGDENVVEVLAGKAAAEHVAAEESEEELTAPGQVGPGTDPMAADETTPATPTTRRLLLRDMSERSGSNFVGDVMGVGHGVISLSSLPIWHFFLGVMNALTTTYIVGRFPAFLWLYALVEFFVLVTNLIVFHWVPQKMTLYLAEFCWVANALGWTFVATEALEYAGWAHTPLDDFTRKAAASAFFGVANGPICLAAIMNANALVFHDVQRTSSFFIHFSPALVSWTMRWRRPGARLFALSTSFASGNGTAVHGGTMIWMMPLALYAAWWCVYAPWLIAVGCRLPDRGYGRSSFQDMTGPISKVFGVPHSRRRLQACVYCVVHAVACSVAIVALPSLVYNSFILHTATLCALLCSGVYQGARYYRYSFGPKLEKLIQKALEAEIAKTKID